MKAALPRFLMPLVLSQATHEGALFSVILDVHLKVKVNARMNHSLVAAPSSSVTFISQSDHLGWFGRCA